VCRRWLFFVEEKKKRGVGSTLNYEEFLLGVLRNSREVQKNGDPRGPIRIRNGSKRKAVGNQEDSQASITP